LSVKISGCQDAPQNTIRRIKTMELTSMPRKIEVEEIGDIHRCPGVRMSRYQLREFIRDLVYDLSFTDANEFILFFGLEENDEEGE
jgi:hypothetical protein